MGIITQALKREMPVDGVILLDGAMVTESHDDAEGEILPASTGNRRVRTARCRHPGPARKRNGKHGVPGRHHHHLPDDAAYRDVRDRRACRPPAAASDAG